MKAAILTSSSAADKRLKRKAIYLLYRTLQTVLAPLVLLYFVVRGLRQPRYFATLRQRTGELPALWQKTAAGVIWLHAVSVGEVLAAIPLLAELRQKMPRAPLYVSTATLAGLDTSQSRLTELAEGVFYAPLDYAWMVRRVLRRLQPSVVVVMETEIWPNLFREAKRIGCGLVLVNGRISDRALPRYRNFAGVFGPVLGLCDRILTQSEEMRRRFIAAGAPPAATIVAGNLKYDFTLPVLPADSPVRSFLGGRMWIAASTSTDGVIAEEDFVLSAQAALSKEGWRLILAPRKPERFAEVATRLSASGMRWTRRTALTDPGADVLLLDSVGELAALFPYAAAVFMGGTLAAIGGHNILEPAIAGKPVVAGPHLENFRDIERHFDAQQAMLRITGGSELADAIRRTTDELGERGRRAAMSQTGAARRAADEIQTAADTHYPVIRPAQPLFAFYWLLAKLWGAASARDRAKKMARTQKLPVPVVSIGNITTGGTGKTPMAIALLQAFAGEEPGMLTRGYGRNAPGVVILGSGHQATCELTGDEPQLVSRATGAPIAIGANRFEDGKQLLEVHPCRLLFLDDGLQHLQLKRDFDLVLIDGLNPFGGGYLLPLGRLREPLAGLKRANAFVITRIGQVAHPKAIERLLPGPVFHARTVPTAWRNQAGQTFPVDHFTGAPALAFCGLGNPNAFWNTLASIGVTPIERYTWEDHHRYRPGELRRLTHRATVIGAKAMLTTEKDSINIGFPADNVYWLEVAMEIEKKDELIELISASLSKRYSSMRSES
jgi:tetraacyldisaccharide 4'-kinase